MMRTAIVLAWLCAVGLGNEPTPKGVELGSAHETLREQGLKTDAKSALNYLRQRTLDPEKTQAIERWIDRLGDEEFTVREEATKRLLLLGDTATSLLKSYEKDDDPERAKRVRRCLDAINTGSDLRLAMAIVRIVGIEAPQGSLEALLQFVPQSTEEALSNELADAIRRVAIHGATTDPRLLAALDDKNPQRRAMASRVVARYAGKEHRAAVVNKLNDDDLHVRFAAASNLAYVGEKAAVPVLIEFLAKGPTDLAYRAEDLLYRLAGKGVPKVALSKAEPNDRRASHDAWTTWLTDQGDNLTLRSLPEMASLGVTLVCEMEGGTNSKGRVFEYGPDGNVRWELDGLGGPIDAQRTSSGRVLVAELSASRVTERDRTGKITFEKKLEDGPQVAQPLANGNIFIATYHHLMEVTRQGETLYDFKVDDGSIYYAKRQPNGRVFYVGNNKEIVEIDPRTEKIHRRIPAGDTSNWGSVDPLPNGNFLVARCGLHTVVEVTPDGKDVWSVSIQWPTWAARLPNGHTIVACAHSSQVAEFDRQGKRVWHRELKTRPARCRKY